MYGFTWTEILLAIVVWWLVFGWPVTKILARLGYSKWWVLLTFVPLGNIIGLWTLATSPWPRDGDDKRYSDPVLRN